jgi:hypothetical protein
MSKVTKYPKYKEEAYSRLDKLFKGILNESGFYTQHPELDSEGLVFSHDPNENIKGEISVSARGTNLLKLHGKEIIYSIPRGIRLSLTSEERQVVVENVNILFSIGKYSNVIKYIGDLHSWYVSSEICRFCGVYGETYINSKSYRPQLVAQFPKKPNN